MHFVMLYGWILAYVLMAVVTGVTMEYISKRWPHLSFKDEDVGFAMLVWPLVWAGLLGGGTCHMIGHVLRLLTRKKKDPPHKGGP